MKKGTIIFVCLFAYIIISLITFVAIFTIDLLNNDDQDRVVEKSIELRSQTELSFMEIDTRALHDLCNLKLTNTSGEEVKLLAIKTSLMEEKEPINEVIAPNGQKEFSVSYTTSSSTFEVEVFLEYGGGKYSSELVFETVSIDPSYKFNKEKEEERSWIDSYINGFLNNFRSGG